MKRFSAFLLVLAAVSASAQTADLRRDLERMDRRLRALEAAPSLRVLSRPGMVPQQWTEVPGWRTLELVPAGGTTFETTSGQKTVRVVVRTTGGAGQLSVTNGIGGDGGASPLRVRLGAGLAFDGSGNVSLSMPDCAYFPQGITLGTNAWTNEAGTLRWDPATTNVQFSDGSGWREVGRGSSSVTNFGWGLAGSGTTNPLSVDPTVFVNTNLGFGLIGSGLEGDPVRVDRDQVVYQLAADRLPESYLSWDGSNYVSTYGPRLSVSYASWLSSIGTNAPQATNSWPGTLVESGGSTYQLLKFLDHPAYLAEYGQIAPGLADATWWQVFASKGAIGMTGAPGNDGQNGVGNVFYGVWDNGIGYVYDTNAIPLVSYGGQLYSAIASSTGAVPSESASSWAVAVAKGVDARNVGATNLVYRGGWETLGTYVSNDVVSWCGNLFYVTTNDPPAGTAPALDGDLVGSNTFHWSVLVAKGGRGARGPQGEAGAVTYVTNLFYLYGPDGTFFVATNEPSAEGDMLFYAGASGTNEMLRWGPPASLSAADATNVAGAVFAALAGPAFRTAWTAELAGTEARLWPASNWFWRLDTAAGSVETWALPVDGREDGEAALVGLEVFRAESNSWAWPSGLTNAPPEVGKTNLFLLHLPSGATNWTIY